MKIIQTIRFALALAALTTLSMLNIGVAHAHFVAKESYVLDVRGNIIKDSYGECWRTGYWTPAAAIPECDPTLVKKEEPVVAAPPPAPVIAPPPAPAAVAPPPPAPAPAPVPKKLTLSADSLFAFDKADIKPDAHAKLDQFLQDIKGVNYDLIKVTGHTDRIGSPSYNMKLSLRRAEAVKAYLVKHGGIDPKKITTVGKGETEPVTKPGQCRGQKVTKALIACKQPDRRVEVEVTGTK